MPGKIQIPNTVAGWNEAAQEYLPGHLGMVFDTIEPDKVCARFTIAPHHLSWNGFLHAASVVALADTCCGYGTLRSLPDGADGFTTIDLSSNFLGTALSGDVLCEATPLHQGRSTQVWDARVFAGASGKTIAQFRCSQMILWPRG